MSAKMPFTCIYCKRCGQKPAREHVIPEAFGKFGGKTPVLHCVCLECNNGFSGQFEQDFSRSSIEATGRWRYGMKSPETRTQIDSRRIKFSAKGGDFDGLRLDPVTHEFEGQIEVSRRDNGERVSLTIAELRRLNPMDAAKFDFSVYKKTIREPHQDEEIHQELRRLGFQVASQGELKAIQITKGARLSATATISLDIKTARAAAKISFNYLALVCGPDFALLPEFDDIRALILKGTKPQKAAVVIAGFQENAKRPPLDKPGHLLTLHLQGESIIYGRVSLFSSHTYHVALTMDSPKRVPRYLIPGIGHFCDFTEKTVQRVPPDILREWNSPSPGNSAETSTLRIDGSQ